MTPARRIGAAALVVVVVVAVIFYLGVYKPQSKKLSAAHAARATAESKVSSLQGQVSSLQVLARQIPSDKAKLAQYENEIPDNPELPTVLDQVHTAAGSAGVTLSSVDPSSVPLKGAASASSSSSSSSELNGVPTMSLALSATGSYSQLMSFIKALDSMERTLVVTGLSVSGSEPKLTASLSTDVFYAGQPTP